MGGMGWVKRRKNQALSEGQVLFGNSPHSASCMAVLTSKYLYIELEAGYAYVPHTNVEWAQQ